MGFAWNNSEKSCPRINLSMGQLKIKEAMRESIFLKNPFTF